MSRQAIAAALAREDLAGGERLVAFSLASFAGHDGRAWPGASAAAARAGLSRSRYRHLRDQLVGRGLIVVEELAPGRGRASTVVLRFAADGPWWEGEINAELFETVLSRTHARGPARLLLAAMAALADPCGVVSGVLSDELCAAGRVADRTYRRARRQLLDSGELVLQSGAVGRGNTNVWQVRAPAQTPAVGRAARSRRRVAPPAGTRPLLSSVATPARASATADDARPRADAGDCESGATGGGKDPVLTGVSAGRGGRDRTVSVDNCPVWSGVSPPKGGHDRTLFELPTPENPAENPAANTRARRESQNPRITHPPNPPEGGSHPRSTLIEHIYISDRGRRRRRIVRVDLDEIGQRLGIPTAPDRGDWHEIRKLPERTVGGTRFAIWLESAKLIAVDDERRLIVAIPAATAAWTANRFGRVLASCAGRVGRELRFASEPEVHALSGTELRAQELRQLQAANPPTPSLNTAHTETPRPRSMTTTSQEEHPPLADRPEASGRPRRLIGSPSHFLRINERVEADPRARLLPVSRERASTLAASELVFPAARERGGRLSSRFRVFRKEVSTPAGRR